MLETVVLLNIFEETIMHFFQDYLMNRNCWPLTAVNHLVLLQLFSVNIVGVPYWTICLLLFAFKLEDKLAWKRPLSSFSKMDAGIFSSAKISVNQKMTEAPQTNTVSRQVNITHDSVYCCFTFHGDEWFFSKRVTVTSPVFP